MALGDGEDWLPKCVDPNLEESQRKLACKGALWDRIFGHCLLEPSRGK